MAAPYVWVSFPDNDTYDEIRYSFTPYTDTDFFFWAFQYYLANSDSGGYIGMQTNASANLGKAVIFSQWNSTEGSPGKLTPNVSQPFGGEGEGWQNLAHFPWVVGRTYQLKLRRDVISTTNAQLSAYVNDIHFGSSIVPVEWGAFSSGGHVCWTERYGGGDPKPVARARWRDIRALPSNGRRAKKPEAYYPIVLGDPPITASITMLRDGFEQRIG